MSLRDPLRHVQQSQARKQKGFVWQVGAKDWGLSPICLRVLGSNAEKASKLNFQSGLQGHYESIFAKVGE